HVEPARHALGRARACPGGRAGAAARASERQRGDLARREHGVRARAILVDAIARNVDRGRPDQGIVVIAIPTTEERAPSPVLAIRGAAERAERHLAERRAALQGRYDVGLAIERARRARRQSERRERSQEAENRRETSEQALSEVRAPGDDEE